MFKGKQKYYLTVGVIAAAIVIVLAAIYLPWYKLLPKPSTRNITFLHAPEIQGRKSFALLFDLEVDPAKSTPRGLYRGIAHSGSYSSGAFGKNRYSILVRKKISELSYPNLDQLHFSAWIYVLPGKKLPAGMLVLSIKTPTGEKLYWNGVPVAGKYIPREQWFKVSGEANLSGIKIRPDDELTLCFWNRSKTRILADDFFLVAGSPPERYGDSARVDFTKNRAYTARPNMPPFPVFYLTRENTGYKDRGSLTGEGHDELSGIQYADLVVAGQFLSTANGPESVFTVGTDGTAGLYTYCKSSGQFTRAVVTTAGPLKAMLQGAQLAAGNLAGSGTAQVLIVNGKNIAVATIKGSVDPCQQDAKGLLSLEEIWQSSSGAINGTRIENGHYLLADVNGDRKDELLVYPGNGTWSLFGFSGTGWATIASSTGNRIGEWDSDQFDFTLHAGRFIPSASTDMILAVFNKKGTRNFRYSLLKYSATETKWVPVYPAWSGNTGTTFGLDTLRTTDLYFTGTFAKGTAPFFVKYNRDWRFDMKEVCFTDTSFRVTGNIDFTGYERDYNPKYYEVMKLIPGRFLDPVVTSFLVISCNCREYDPKTGECKVAEDSPGLPSRIAVYSFQPLTVPGR